MACESHVASRGLAVELGMAASTEAASDGAAGGREVAGRPATGMDGVGEPVAVGEGKGSDPASEAGEIASFATMQRCDRGNAVICKMQSRNHLHLRMQVALIR
jgi:hypothetical protein